MGTHGASARFTFNTPSSASNENEEYYDNTTVSNGYTPHGHEDDDDRTELDNHCDDGEVTVTEDLESIQYTMTDDDVDRLSQISESQLKSLDGIINHFWRVIDIASTRKIPFEILKISLRVKNVKIKENHWDILLNELTHFQPSKNITLRMFKDFIFDRSCDGDNGNSRYYRNESQIIG